MIPEDFEITNTYEELLCLMALRKWYEDKIEPEKVQPHLSARLAEVDDLINRSS